VDEVSQDLKTYPNLNALWGEMLAGSLHAAGVRLAVISPGSRNTPIVLGLVGQADIQCLPILDERSAGFFALGAARASGRPVALVCTSGSAGANYLPAVVEASYSGTPLLVLTADRPPEMRDCQSGQTIDQQKLYGDYVTLYHELSTPEASTPRLRYLRETVAHAVQVSKESQRPVHLNVPLRDPLAPTGDAAECIQFSDTGAYFNAEETHQPDPPTGSQARVLEEMRRHKRGLILVGACNVAEPLPFVQAVERLSLHLGWPVLSDGLNPLRTHAGQLTYPVFHYENILRSTEAKNLLPEAVLQISSVPTSKTLRAWLGVLDIPLWQVSATGHNLNALHLRCEGMFKDIRELLPTAELPAGDAAYARQWMTAEATVAQAVDAALEGEGSLFEGKAAWMLARHVPEGADVVVANSMQVRNVEFFWPAGDSGARLFSSRGANGIDGTLSTALGIAHCGRPTFLLTGDLALLHDTNGFLAAAKLRGALTIILIHNDGGGIFERLPVSQLGEIFEDFFATPQQVDIAKLADAYGVAHQRIDSWEAFQKALTAPWQQGVRILELRTDRKADTSRTNALLR